MANLNLDPAHSGVNFSIQHLVVSNVKDVLTNLTLTFQVISMI